MAVLSLTFEDGTASAVPIKARGMVEAERHFGKNIPPMEATFFAAWVQLGKPATFDEWLDTVATFNEATEDPTPAPAS